MTNRPTPRRDSQADLVDQAKDALTQGSDGHRQRLFEARDSLAELKAVVSDGPRPGLDDLCETILDLLGLMLRKGAIAEPDGLSVAMRLVDYVGVALSTPAPLRALDPPAASDETDETDETVATEEEARPAAPGAKVRRKDLSLDSADQTRLGEILVELGTIEADVLDRALVLQRVVHQRLGEVLVSVGVLSDQTLSEALEVQRERTIEIATSRKSERSGDAPRQVG